MSKLQIFCSSLNYYNILEKLPSYISPLGLGDNIFPSSWLNEKKGTNISELNKYYGEFTGFYWIWKNKIQDFKKKDMIGFCHYRKLWMNDLYTHKNKFSLKSLHSNLLNINNDILNTAEAIQVQPINFTNKNLFSDFEKVHKTNVLKDCMSFLRPNLKKEFLNHVNKQLLFPNNMFITKVVNFEEYCNVIFPWLEKCMNYCYENKLCNGYNVRLPAFLGERFTSFWFNRFEKRSLLSYARLGKFHLSNSLNSFTNTTKLPFTFYQYPTIHKF
tara:strand:- start:104 stop:919 length:816 start_codon:yes stop_codon:yes gene_type:complete